jgi:hypothetical protein
VPCAKAHISRIYRWVWTDKYSDDDVDDIAAMIARAVNWYRV